METETTQSYKSGYEAGFYGQKAWNKAQFTGGIRYLEADWKEYRKGVKQGKEDKLGGYEYNHG